MEAKSSAVKPEPAPRCLALRVMSALYSRSHVTILVLPRWAAQCSNVRPVKKEFTSNVPRCRAVFTLCIFPAFTSRNISGSTAFLLVRGAFTDAVFFLPTTCQPESEFRGVRRLFRGFWGLVVAALCGLAPGVRGLAPRGVYGLELPLAFELTLLRELFLLIGICGGVLTLARESFLVIGIFGGFLRFPQVSVSPLACGDTLGLLRRKEDSIIFF